jgi:hypothetical protein
VGYGVEMRYLVFNIGCLECGVPSGVVGIYETSGEACVKAAKLDEVAEWRNGGQNRYEVYPIEDGFWENEEYREELSKKW